MCIRDRSNAVGSTFGDAYAQQMKVAAYVKSFTKADALKVEMKVAQGINAVSYTHL